MSATPILVGSFVLVLLTQCWMSRRGPLAVLVDWVQHLRALWFWLTREAGPGVWERRGRYREHLEIVRRGWV